VRIISLEGFCPRLSLLKLHRKYTNMESPNCFKNDQGIMRKDWLAIRLKAKLVAALEDSVQAGGLIAYHVVNSVFDGTNRDAHS
jgi:hypothetical protein